LLNDDARPVQASVDPRQASVAALASAFYPLTMPLTVGPGSISIAITIGATHSHAADRLLLELVAATLGTAVVTLLILLTYRYAERVAVYIGPMVTNVIVRLSAFIVLSIGVKIAWSGGKALLREAGVHL